jgi:hypothetical protein
MMQEHRQLIKQANTASGDQLDKQTQEHRQLIKQASTSSGDQLDKQTQIF